MSDTRNHTTRDQLAAALREHDPEPYFPGNWEDEAYYQGFADALLASDAIAAVRAATWDEALEAVANERGSFGMQTRNPYRAARWDDAADAMFIDKAREAMRDTGQEPQ